MPLFKGCSNGCWFTRTIETPFANTHLWAPDSVHDCVDWNVASFVHGDQRHGEVSSGPASNVPSLFFGSDEIGVEEYVQYAKEYKLA